MGINIDAGLLQDVGKALGILNPDGSSRNSWFDSPAANFKRILSDPDQSTAFWQALAIIAPPSTDSFVPAGQTWYPIIPDSGTAGLYIYKTPAEPASAVGFVAALGSPDPQKGQANLLLTWELLRCAPNDTTFSVAGPVTIQLTVQLNLAGPPLAVASAVVVATIGESSDVTITLQNISIGDAVLPALTVDLVHSTQFDEQVVHLILATLAQQPGLAALTRLLGLDRTPSVPPIPVQTLTDGFAGIRAWFSGILGGAGLQVWCEALAQLLDTPRPSGSGTTADPVIIPLGPAQCGLTLAHSTSNGTAGSGEVDLGLRATLSDTGFTLQANLALASLPLNGGTPEVLPNGSILLTLPTPVSTASVSVQSLIAGVSFAHPSSNPLKPVLQLTGVKLGSKTLGTVDALSVANLEALGLSDLSAALGVGKSQADPGRHLAALIGLMRPSIEPANDPSATNILLAADLTGDLLGAIARIHRAILTTPSDSWIRPFTDLTALLGLPPPEAGPAGTLADPWHSLVEQPAETAVRLELIAWNNAKPADDMQTLRIGLRLAATEANWNGWYVVELIAFDLPSDTTKTKTTVLEGQHASLSIGQINGGGITVTGLSINADAERGLPVSYAVAAQDLTVTPLGGSAVALGNLSWGPLPSIDLTLPDLGFKLSGGSGASLPTIILDLLRLALGSLGGTTGLALGELFGFGGTGLGNELQLPAISLPDLKTLLGSPSGFLVNWLNALFTSNASLPTLWLQGLGGFLRGLFDTSPAVQPEPALTVTGSGTYDDPWAVALDAGTPTLQALAWLEPNGPPAAWSKVASDALAAAADPLCMLSALQRLAPYSGAPNAFAAVDKQKLAQGLASLATNLPNSDGLVSAAAAVPASPLPPGWSTGTLIATSHLHLPSHPDTIAQIKAKLTDWAVKGVLLLAPPFADHTVWTTLVTALSQGGPATNYALRGATTSVSLQQFGPVTQHATAELTSGSEPQYLKTILSTMTASLGGPVALVAFSGSGSAAATFAAANPQLVGGLITLGSPFGGASLEPLTDSPTAEAVRFLERVLPANALQPPLSNVLSDLSQLLDGFTPAAKGQPGRPLTLSSAQFAAFKPPAMGSVPAFALAGSLGAIDVIGALRSALSQLATSALGRAGPTHVAFGLCTAATVADAELTDQLALLARADLLRLPLAPGAPAPTQPLPRVAVSGTVSRPGGWLLGDAGAGFTGTTTRLRLLDFDASWQPTATPPSSVNLTLHDCSLNGPTTGLAVPGDTIIEGVLAALLQADGPFIATAPGQALYKLLVAAGLAEAKKHAIIHDTFSLLGTMDAEGTSVAQDTSNVAGKVPALLDWLFGSIFANAPGPPWTFTGHSLPLKATLSASPGSHLPSSLAIVTTAGGLAFGPAASGKGSITVNLTSGAVHATGSVSLGPLQLAIQDAAVTIAAPPWLDPIGFPIAVADQKRAAEALGRLFAAQIAAAVLNRAWTIPVSAGFIDGLLNADQGWFASVAGFGKADTNGLGLDVTRFTAIAGGLAKLTGLPGPALALPGDTLSLVFAQAPDGRAVVATATAKAGAATVSANATIDAGLRFALSGSAVLTVTLPGRVPSITLSAGTGPAGATLSAQLGSGGTISILPKLSGLEALVTGDAGPALGQVLDAMAAAGNAANVAKVKQIGFDLGLLPNSTAAFTDPAAQLLPFLENPALLEAALAKSGVSVAHDLASLFNGAGFLLLPQPWTVSAPSPNLLQFGLTSGSSTIALQAGWTGDTATGGPTFGLSLSDTAGSMKISFSGTYVRQSGKDHPKFDASVALLKVPLPEGVVPTLELSFANDQFTASLWPTGEPASKKPTVQYPQLRLQTTAPSLELLPPDPGAVMVQILLPVATQILIGSAKKLPQWNNSVWPGGPTVDVVLKGAGLLTETGQIQFPNLPTASDPGFGPALLKQLANILGGAATALFPATGLPMTGGQDIKLSLRPVGGSGVIGLAVSGSIAVPVDPYTFTLALGDDTTWPTAWNTEPNLASDPPGLVFELDTTKSPPAVSFKACKAGLRVARSDNTPMVNSSVFMLGTAEVWTFCHADSGGFQFDSGGMSLGGVGIPIDEILSGTGGSNPVVSNLLGSGGSRSGDASPTNPSFNFVFDDYKKNAELLISAPGQAVNAPGQLIWIPVQASFGPLYLDKIGISGTGGNLVIGVDGSVKVDGLELDLDDLSITAPIASLSNLSTWGLDLQGLALNWAPAGLITITGGLDKSIVNATEYDGMLSVQAAGVGVTVVGSYADPDYPSFVFFAVLDATFGGPPYCFVLGVGGGGGYNRNFIPPATVDDVPNSFLIKALNTFRGDPMAVVQSAGSESPPARGGIWIGAGVRFSSFVFIETTAVVYLALDGGVDVGILGTAAMQFPSSDFTIISVELALKAEFSSQQGLLSVQAQLTDNSWLLSKDCQLTGGFAFFIWFNNQQFLITLGGYNPTFQKPSYFPDVPRLGFNWAVSKVLTIKGQSYFALCSTAIMAGARLDATLNVPCVNLWATAYADFLVSWDPFYYKIDIGISVGATFSINILFGTISVTVSIGADLAIDGPPFHGSADVHLEICTVTVLFGNKSTKPQGLHWQNFVTKYLGDTSKINTIVPVSGIVPPASGTTPPDGSSNANAWTLNFSFSLQITTSVPALSAEVTVVGISDIAQPTLDPTPLPPNSSWVISSTTADALHVDTKQYSLNLGPMNGETLTTSHLKVKIQKTYGDPLVQKSFQATADATVQPITVSMLHSSFPVATWLDTWDSVSGQPPANASTIHALSGLAITVNSQWMNKSIVTREIAANPLHRLPFTVPPDIVSTWHQWGAIAAVVKSNFGNLSNAKLQVAAARLLAPSATIASAQKTVDGTTPHVPPLAIRSMLGASSAPPSIGSLAEGLTMQHQRFIPVPEAPARLRTQAVPLTTPRLRSVLKSHLTAPGPVSAGSRTSAAQTGAGLSRTPVPTWPQVPGSRLVRRSAASASLAVGAVSPRTTRNADFGWSLGSAARTQMTAVRSQMTAAGVSLPSGTTQIWDLTSTTARTVRLTGDSAARVVGLSPLGEILLCTETAASAEGESVALPAGTGRLCVTALGVPTAAAGPSFAAITSTSAPSQAIAATGWHSGIAAIQVAPATLLVRGGTVRLSRALRNRIGRQIAPEGIVVIDAATVETEATSTTLGADTMVVVLQLLGTDAGSIEANDLALKVQGATLGAPVLSVDGACVTLAYDVTTQKNASTITISVASRGAWRVQGVVGLAGKAADWTSTLSSHLSLVPQTPLTSFGQVTVILPN